MIAGVNIGDIIFQLLTIGVSIFFLIILFVFWRSSKIKREQFNRIEEKFSSIQKRDY
ncbi:DUF4083 domain-containing protein [Peribacillus frigoritolerans]|uniref:DUF4083 domain-containing protein n=1 Tax=Peribacillus frigoritolerans TaxID=450367 RepID=UPI0020BFE30D|nr:DUF4083 domain-containing protein [Peribacillus frigoritolerans]MEE3954382.1 DUF4083 domain-containing protein [Peribacillus frigoritolerans]